MRLFVSAVLVLGLVTSSFAADKLMEDTMSFGKFGAIHLYRNSKEPQRVVLFISGDGGWNLGVVDMARSLASLNALVIGTNITHFLKELEAGPEKCSYPAADFEALSQFVQKKLNFQTYHVPCLVGYSSGATLVYALLVQAPPNTFQGAISLGFCPDLPLTKPFCKGHGLEFEPGPKGKGYSFLPAPHLEMPWIAFQGLIDQVCDPKTVESYVKKVGRGEIVSLPKVGHGFSVPRNWLPQFIEAYKRLEKEGQIDRTPSEAEMKDLPLVTVQPDGKESNMMAVIISGDGGWASIDREIGAVLAHEGIPVIGLNALKYFWNRRTPDEASGDLNRIIRFYLDRWHKDQAVLIGYSRGADVLPFMVNRLPEEILAKVPLIGLLGPEKEVDFQFHLSDFIGTASHSTDLPTRPEVEKLYGRNVLCLYGDDEKESLCTDLDSTKIHIKVMKGGHHFGGDYKQIGEILIQAIH